MIKDIVVLFYYYLYSFILFPFMGIKGINKRIINNNERRTKLKEKIKKENGNVYKILMFILVLIAAIYIIYFSFFVG